MAVPLHTLGADAKDDCRDAEPSTSVLQEDMVTPFEVEETTGGSTKSEEPFQEPAKGKEPQQFRKPIPRPPEAEAGPSKPTQPAGLSPGFTNEDPAHSQASPAKTWEGMKMAIDQAFEKIDGVLGYHVPEDHYDLHSSGPQTTAKRLNSAPHDSPPKAASLPQPRPVSSRPNATSRPPPWPPLSFIVLPDFWEDLIQPGMTVTMSMWPFNVSVSPTNLQRLQPMGRRPANMSPGFGLGNAPGVAIPVRRPLDHRLNMAMAGSGADMKRSGVVGL
ncbi:hypothetical protein G7046_g7442 [Stylonectria norvegica]|nr:hypothetical protein G7046_g7442 [Stylonectria norvegica]